MESKGKIILQHGIYYGENKSLYVFPRVPYDWYEIVDKQIVCEQCDDGPRYERCYRIVINDNDVFLPVEFCIDVNSLPNDFNFDTAINSIENRILDKTPDALQAYEEAFGITKEMIYSPDGFVIIEKDEQPKKEKQDKKDQDLSRLPFIY